MVQREKGRRGVMSSVDKSMQIVQAKQQKRQEAKVRRKAVDNIQALTRKRTVVLETSSGEEQLSKEEIPGPSKSPAKKRGKNNLNAITPDLAAALNRNRVSDRAVLTTA